MRVRILSQTDFTGHSFNSGQYMVDTGAMHTLSTKLTSLQGRVRSIDDKIASLQIERTSVCAEVEDIKTTIRVLEKMGIVAPSTAVADLSAAGRFSGLSQPDMAAIILRESGKPMRAADIVDEMGKAGVDITDAERIRNSLFTSMSRRTDVFRKLGSGVWGLVGARYPDDEQGLDIDINKVPHI